jgi:hypothetical protein
VILILPLPLEIKKLPLFTKRQLLYDMSKCQEGGSLVMYRDLPRQRERVAYPRFGQVVPVVFLVPVGGEEFPSCLPEPNLRLIIA